MSNEEIKPKPAPEYELLKSGNYSPKECVIRKTEAVDFKLDDLYNYKIDIEKEFSKHDGMISYNKSVIENIKGFHPEVIEFYESLENEKKTAMLLFCQSLKDIEKNEFLAKGYKKESDDIQKEIDDIEQKFGLVEPKN